MGEVYRARDTRLEREVAIKVLPAAVAGDPERLDRFDREARLLATLNHPTIAGVYGLHEDAGVRFIAMELVPGEDLADVVQRGPVPHDRAMEVAMQVADALEAAHERGIIHRDLKPANIKITPDARVKVLDFGLAKAFEVDPATSSASLTMSPTITTAGTVAGMILGTAAYMAPEQARGQAVDKRADIWAFGAVLYQMLTGKMPFSGETVSDTLASVLKLEPNWDALPADTPASTTRLLRRCLEKDPKKRLRDIGEARIRIDRTLSGEVKAEELEPSAGIVSTPASARSTVLPWLVAAGALLVGAAGFTLPGLLTTETSAQVVRFELDVAEELDFSEPGPPMVMSPDGERLAYLAGDPRRLYVRRIDQFEGIALNDTDGASQPFFSPDGEWIGFFAKNEMKKISIYGGAAIKLADIQAPRGGAWSEDGTIIYTPNLMTGLHRISDNGGRPEQLTDPETDDGVRSHRWPHVLPGGKGVLFTVQPDGKSFDDSNIERLDLASGERRVVATGGSFGGYAPTGHLTYVHAGTMFAMPFDLSMQQATGPPVPVAEDVVYDSRNGGAQASYSPAGHMVYLSGGVVSTQVNVAWIDMDGTLTPLFEELGDYSTPRVSPDGIRVLMDFSSSSSQEDVWIHDLERGSMSRLTFDTTNDFGAIWSPDGRSIVYSSLRESSVPNLWMKAADGSGEAERLGSTKEAQFVGSFSPDARYLMYRQAGAGTDWDLHVMDMQDRSVDVFLRTDFSESNPEFSPDGKWVAYDSNESGRYEAYVRAFPAGGGKWQISADGGGNAVWGSDGKTLYYGSNSRLMAVDYTTEGQVFRPGRPRVVLDGGLLEPGGFRSYDIAPDGRILTVVNRTDGTDNPVRTRVILNWFTELADRTK